ncbi:MAG: hypothetical protein FWD76_02480 [Firmicutes bacterium]|nr:hypothetical protein [Bacillota bacterium]
MKKRTIASGVAVTTNKLTRWLALAFVLVLMTSAVVVGTTQQQRVREMGNDLVVQKQALVQESLGLEQNLTATQKLQRDEQVDNIIKDTTIDKITRQQRLSDLGVKGLGDDRELLRKSSTNDVTIGKPIVRYDAVTTEWILSFSANWKTLDNLENTFMLFPVVGNVNKVGSMDVAGVWLTDNYGTATGFSYVSGSCEFQGISVGSDSSDRTNNRDGALSPESAKGVFFSVQDRIRVLKTGLFNSTIEYNASVIFVQARYSKGFENYHGNARSVYVHTAGSSSINSIGIGGDGISLGWSDDADGWAVASGDTAF